MELQSKPERVYNAVTTFRPAGLVQRRLSREDAKPVPGLWNGVDELCISCNKTFSR